MAPPFTSVPHNAHLSHIIHYLPFIPFISTNYCIFFLFLHLSSFLFWFLYLFLIFASSLFSVAGEGCCESGDFDIFAVFILFSFPVAYCLLTVLCIFYFFSYATNSFIFSSSSSTIIYSQLLRFITKFKLFFIPELSYFPFIYHPYLPLLLSLCPPHYHPHIYLHYFSLDYFCSNFCSYYSFFYIFPFTVPSRNSFLLFLLILPVFIITLNYLPFPFSHFSLLLPFTSLLYSPIPANSCPFPSSSSSSSSLSTPLLPPLVSQSRV